MSRLLTVAIPTFNRAQILNQQLAWLADAIRGFESECEVIVSDNCSPDNTQDVIQKWQSIFADRGVIFKANRNPENMGLVKNIAYCINAATSKYIWTVGDDDPIEKNALGFVISKVKENPDVSLIYLNFSGRDKATGKIIGEHWFESDTDAATPDGKAAFGRCLEKSIGSVIFITATVYRTELAQRAIKLWPGSLNNYMGQAFWTGLCAAEGSVIVTKDNYMECTMGVSAWLKDPKHGIKMQYKHIPEVIVKLQEIGYSKRFCQQMILKEFKQVNLKVFLGALRRWPLLTMKIGIPFITLVGKSAFDLSTSKDAKREAVELSYSR